MNNELLPCPFCGEKTDDGFLPHRGSCYIMQKAVGASPEILKDAWNTRADKAAPVERIDGLKEALSIFEKGIPDLTDYEIVGVYLADCEKYEDRCHMVVKAARAYLKLQRGE